MSVDSGDISPLDSPSPPNPPRKPGGWEGRVWMSPDFDDLPEEFLRYCTEPDLELNKAFDHMPDGELPRFEN